MDNILPIILFLCSSKHTQETRGASVHVTHVTLVFFSNKQKIIARDHRSRHPQTLTISICCILIDGDAHIITQMNFSTIGIFEIARTSALVQQLTRCVHQRYHEMTFVVRHVCTYVCTSSVSSETRERRTIFNVTEMTCTRCTNMTVTDIYSRFSKP